MKSGRLGQSSNGNKALPFALISVFAAVIFLLHTPQTVSAGANQPNQPSQPKESASELLRDVVWNEVHMQERDHSYWRYREVRKENGKTEALEIFETPHGQVHRLLSINGVPLSGKQKEDEERRIEKLANHPEQVEEAQKKRAEDGDEELRLLKMLPSAFSFRYDGTTDGAITLKFTPNPNFHPASHEAEVFHHMEGTILVEPQMKRLLEIDGTLTSDVKFGAGLLGHLYKGGTFRVRQRDVGEGHWDMTLLNVHMDGRALFFKTIAVHQDESYSDYKRVPSNTSLREAVQLLRSDTAS